MSLLQKSIIMFIIVTHYNIYTIYYSFKAIKQYCKVTKATNKK